MTGRIRIVALVIGTVIGTACGGSGGGHATPLVLETPAPTRPPGVHFITDGRDGDPSPLGRLYTSDWSPAPPSATRAARTPVRWPPASAIDTIVDPLIAFDTSSVPDFVTVSSFSSVRSGTGVPTAAPIATFECARFTSPRCRFTTTATRVTLRGVGRNLLTGAFLTVFGTWHADPHDASASWLFRLERP